MSEKPLIGVTPLLDKDRASYWMLPGYFKGLLSGGAVPVMLPMSSDPTVLLPVLSALDGVLFTGGQDVSPMLYNEPKSPQCGEISEERDRMESLLLKLSMEKGLPILGICRGIQLINAVLGGTLWQDLPTEKPSELEHHMAPPYDRAVHEVTLLEGTPLFELLKHQAIGVNSYHHQAIKKLGRGLSAMAVSSDGLVEAVYKPDYRFLWAVQWHPEFSFEKDPKSLKIFEAFQDACKEFHQNKR